MKAFKVTLIFLLTFLVLGLCFFEFRKQMDLQPQIELITQKDWTLTPRQRTDFEKINQAFSSSASLKTFVTEFSSVFKMLSELDFIDDARWSWDHNHPFKIKAYVSTPKAMMFKRNEWFLVNEKWALLKKVTPNQTLDLPIFTDEILVKDEKLRNTCFKILASFESKESSIPVSAVSEISKDRRGISFHLSEGFKVYISDKNPDTQIERVSNVIAYLKREKINVEFIDAQSVQKILVRPKNKKD
jgi:hypothetical protein